MATTTSRTKLPKDAACYMGITCADIYPGPGWNFVFGEASLRERIGVQSLAPRSAAQIL